MIIDNVENLTFEVTNDESSGLVTIVLTDPSGPTVVGTLRIAKTRADAFLETLKVVCREVHGVFETNDKATAKFEDQASGTLEFRDA